MLIESGNDYRAGIIRNIKDYEYFFWWQVVDLQHHSSSVSRLPSPFLSHSHICRPPAIMTASNPTATHSNIVPSEVGWQFVPQYYTFVNKEPHRLHCFYNKNSTFIHGTEGEDMKPCFGQQVGLVCIVGL